MDEERSESTMSVEETDAAAAVARRRRLIGVVAFVGLLLGFAVLSLLDSHNARGAPPGAGIMAAARVTAAARGPAAAGTMASDTPPPPVKRKVQEQPPFGPLPPVTKALPPRIPVSVEASLQSDTIFIVALKCPTVGCCNASACGCATCPPITTEAKAPWKLGLGAPLPLLLLAENSRSGPKPPPAVVPEPVPVVLILTGLVPVLLVAVRRRL